MEWVLDEIRRGHRRRLAVVVPPATTWSLPAYQLAVMLAGETGSVPDASVTLVTPEREPLWIFGNAAGREMSAFLAERGVALRAGTRAAHVTDDVLGWTRVTPWPPTP